MTNWDKCKELLTLDKAKINLGAVNLCNIIHEVRREEYCGKITCEECRNWLIQQYKEPILSYKEKEYLSDVINPFRDKVVNITKLINDDDLEFIEIGLNNNTYAMLPAFAKDTIYKDMVYGKEYALEELGL